VSLTAVANLATDVVDTGGAPEKIQNEPNVIMKKT
jgi:hypothetical protein